MFMEHTLEQLAICIERGKVDQNSRFPVDMQGQDGTDELTVRALEQGISANDILKKGLMVGMKRIGDKFGAGEAYVPDLLVAAKAMNVAMAHLQVFFESGELEHRGTVVLGTIAGDMHDIGKNLVRMILKGDGWDVIDLGVDVAPEKFVEVVAENTECHVGLSAMLTTTMGNMKETNDVIKSKFPNVKVFVGGAPLSQKFSDEIGTDGYFSDPYGFAQHLSTLV
jgi:5-methyltetrahydrofolate--homocysteine methyltransferase